MCGNYFQNTHSIRYFWKLLPQLFGEMTIVVTFVFNHEIFVTIIFTNEIVVTIISENENSSDDNFQTWT